jgi:hypothetical protein
VCRLSSPLVSEEQRRDALRRLKTHLVELGFDVWHQLPIMIVLGDDAPSDLRAFERALLDDIGKGFVLIPLDFEAHIDQLRKSIIVSEQAIVHDYVCSCYTRMHTQSSIPKIQKEIVDRESFADVARNLMHSAANSDLGNYRWMSRACNLSNKV